MPRSAGNTARSRWVTDPAAARFGARLLAVALLLVSGAGRAGELPVDVDVLIHGGTVVTQDATSRVIEGGAVAIRDGAIVAVLQPGEALPGTDRRIDARGKLVIPGLINSHGHAAMSLLRGLADDRPVMQWLNDFIFPAEAGNVDPAFVYQGTLLAAIEMVQGGTTTFADMYYFEEEVARAAVEVGIRGVLGQTVIGFPAPDYRTPELALAGAERFIRQYRDHPLIVPSVAPHALYTTPLAVVKRAHELARKYDVPLQIHAAEVREEDAQVREATGMGSIEALDSIGALGKGTLLHHAIWLGETDIAAIARTGTGVSHNPESNMKTAAGVAPVPALLAAGIAVGIGTDGPASNNNLDLFEEMDSAAKLHKVVSGDATALPARTVFDMATRGGARALGLAERIGSIETGKRADIVLIDLDRPELTPMYDVYSHLVYAIKAGHVDTVLIEGRVVVEAGRVRTVDVDQAMARARRLQTLIRDRLESAPPTAGEIEGAAR